VDSDRKPGAVAGSLLLCVRESTSVEQAVRALSVRIPDPFHLPSLIQTLSILSLDRSQVGPTVLRGRSKQDYGPGTEDD
jgi:hypothetical protein